MTLTKELVNAACRDAAERSRRSRGLLIWDDVAVDAYQAEFGRLFEAAGGVEAWIDLPQQ